MKLKARIFKGPGGSWYIDGYDPNDPVTHTESVWIYTSFEGACADIDSFIRRVSKKIERGEERIVCLADHRRKFALRRLAFYI